MKEIIKALILSAAICTTATSCAATEAEKWEFAKKHFITDVEQELQKHKKKFLIISAAVGLGIGAAGFGIPRYMVSKKENGCEKGDNRILSPKSIPSFLKFMHKLDGTKNKILEWEEQEAFDGFTPAGIFRKNIPYVISGSIVGGSIGFITYKLLVKTKQKSLQKEAVIKLKSIPHNELKDMIPQEIHNLINSKKTSFGLASKSIAQIIEKRIN
jgi:hypothetical protein